jgi:hypothetical protein
VALNISTTYYNIDRRNADALNKLAARAHTLDPTVPVTPFPRQYTINRRTATAVDQIAQAIANADHQRPSVIFGGHYQRPNRVVTQLLIAFEARLTALGH